MKKNICFSRNWLSWLLVQDKGTDAAGKINQNNLKTAQELAEKAINFLR